MLVLNQKAGQTIRVRFGTNAIEIKVLDIGRRQVRLGFDGPREIEVERVPDAKAFTDQPATAGVDEDTTVAATKDTTC